MKTYLFSFLIAVCACFNCKAQNTFAPVGAEWWYGGALYDYTFWDDYSLRWVDHMQSVKDTVVAGKPCRMLATVRYRKNIGNPDAAIIGERDTFFLSNNEDTVFVYDEIISDYTPLFIFNVVAGDTLCLRKANFSSSNISAEFCIVIDSVTLETYDNVQLKSYYNHTIVEGNDQLFMSWGGPIIQANPNRANAGKYTEKIGGNWPKFGSFLPEIGDYNPDSYKSSSGIPTGSFRCYHDAETDIKMVSIPCDSVIKPFVSISEITKADHGISVFPNPSSGMITFKIQKPLKGPLNIQVADLSGRKMASLLLPVGNTILTADLSALSSGVYLLVLQADGRRYYEKLVIRH